MRVTKLILLVWLLLYGGGAAAFDISRMYEVQVLQRGSDRGAALQEALDAMLLRLTADASLLGSQRVSLLRRRVESYVSSYEYLPGGSDDQPLLRVLFAKDSLIKALSDLNIPSWGVSRPKTLVWFVVGDPDGGHRIVTPADNHPALRDFENWSSRFGLPLVYPLLDLEDLAKVGSSELWAGFDDDLLLASRRYDSDAVALVRVDGWQSGQWQLRWHLYTGGEALRWEDVAITTERAAESGVGRMATELGLRFGLDNFDEQQLNSFDISVSGITEFAQMATVITYLHKVHAIRDVQLLAARRGEIEVNLKATLDESGVHNAIVLSNLLIPQGDKHGSYRFNTEVR